jgi:DNA polymerase-3 subunit alpha
MADTSTRGFVHLHTHTEYSPLDGMGRMADLVKAAAADGNIAFAATDHGTLGGLWKLRKFAKAAGITPIPGCEVYMAIGSRFDPQIMWVDADDESGDAIDEDKGTVGALGEKRKKKKIYEHLTLLAVSEQGWKNLVRLHNSAQQTYSPGGGGLAKPQPLMDFDLLEKYHEGIVVLTGCLGGGVAGALVREDVEAARSYLTNLVRIFGPENVYVEVMDHAIPDQRKIIGGLRDLAAEFNLPLVATNDSHYTSCDHDKAHEAWLAVGTKKVLSSEKRFKFHGHGHHLRTEAEMRALFDGADWWQAACDTTVDIAERVSEDVFGGTRMRLPVYDVATLHPDFRPAGVDHSDKRAMSNAYFRHLVSQGLREMYGIAPGDKLPPEVNKRVAWEYTVIRDLGFPDYFLIVRDVIEWCRSTRGLPTKAHPRGREGQKKPIRVGPGRGSAAGSLCSWALRIVRPDPLKNGLLFERFLDPERAGMPDVDVDFEQGRRPEVLVYLARMWGADRVAQIGTFGMARTRAAIKDAARVLERPAVGDKLSKRVPIEGGRPASFAELDSLEYAAGRDFRDLVGKLGDEAAPVLELARVWEDVIKTPGVHASGVLIADEPMFDLVPLRRNRSKGAPANAPMITEWDGPDVEDYGLLKLDVLGLRNLDVISFAVDYVLATTGESVEPDAVDPDNGDQRAQAAWALLRAGKTAGVFQMESEGMTALAMDAGPTCLDDLSSIVALYRPGPLGQGMHHHWANRKRGTEPVDYSIFTGDPAEQAAIATVLDESLAVPVFQEQSMRLGDVVAGFGAATRNRLRKAISKKKQAEIDAVGELWFTGAGQDISPETGEPKIAFSTASATALWDAIKEAGKYQFNKSHSTAYGQLAFATAWLKANWPAEFAAAILATTKDAEKRGKAIFSMRSEGIELLAPDVNLSGTETQPEGTNVRLGLSEVRGVGANAAAIVAEREANGPFTSLADLLGRVHAVPKGAAEQTDEDLEPEEVDPEVEEEESSEAGAMLPVNVVESLITSGALDAFGPRRGQMMITRAVREHPDLAVPDVEWGLLERSGRQRQAIGVITGQHPLSLLGAQLRAYTTPNGKSARPVSTVHQAPERAQVLLLGVLAGYSEKAYSKGRMGRITLEGTQGSIDGVMWDDDRQRLTFEPAVGQVVAISGSVRLREIEVEDESGEVEIVYRRELTFREMWQVPVVDPVVDNFSVSAEDLTVPAGRVEHAPMALLAMPTPGVSLATFTERLPEMVLHSLGDAIHDDPWVDVDGSSTWLYGHGSEAVIVSVGKATTEATNAARDMARANDQDSWVLVGAA